MSNQKLDETPSSRSLSTPQRYLAKSTKWVVSFGCVSALIYFHNSFIVLTVVGAVIGAVLGKVLKKIINEKRPDGATLEDPGMPSSHALQLFYWSTCLVISIVQESNWALQVKIPLSALSFCSAVVSSSWRISAGFHTKEQVAVGAAVGVAHAVVWYTVMRHGLLDVVNPLIQESIIPVVIGTATLGFAGIMLGPIIRFMIRTRKQQRSE